MPPLLPLKGGRFAPLQLSAIFCKELSASLSQNAEPTHPQQCIPRVSALSLHQTHPYVTEAAIYVQDRCFCISAGGRGLSRDSCHHTSPKKSSKCATTTSSELAACNLPYLTTSCTLPPNITFPPRLENHTGRIQVGFCSMMLSNEQNSRVTNQPASPMPVPAPHLAPA